MKDTGTRTHRHRPRLLPTDQDGGTYARVIGRATAGNHVGAYFRTARKDDEAHDHFRIIKNELNKMGLREASLFSDDGSTSLYFRAPDHQVVRITHNSIPNLKRPYCLKPIHSIKADPFDIEIMPRVSMTATQQDVEELYKAALADGYLFWDPKIANVGILDDGTPIIVDRDALIELHNSRKAIRGRSFSYLQFIQCNEKVTGRQHYLDIDASLTTDKAIEELSKSKPAIKRNWKESQDRHCEKYHLERGKLNGVFSEKDIERLREVLIEEGKPDERKESLITQIILEGRHDKETFGEFCERATREYTKKNSKYSSWLEALQKEHERDMKAREK